MRVTVLHDETIVDLARLLVERGRASSPRLIVGIAGIPGAGKSTLAARLAAAMDEQAGVGQVAVASMDGFHLATAALHRLGLHERKGSPETFDAERYLTLLRRCRAGDDVGPVPVYDRASHEPGYRDGPWHCVTPATRVIVTEGNYLLLDRPPWSAVAAVLDETWLLDVPAAQAKQRIIRRHEQGGRSPAAAQRKYENDLRNAELVRTASRRPDRVLCWPGE
ncbi:MAG: hypothetical protein WD534_02020 [Phycisphaeraceae bacterium]